jgi:lipopolysaccharide transport system permease protein
LNLHYPVDTGPKTALAVGNPALRDRRYDPFDNAVVAALRVLNFALLPFVLAWRYRELGRVLLWRELSDRFRGSAVGWLWAIAGPLITLAIYTITFTTAMRLPVASAEGGPARYALSTFVGLIVFNLCSELFYRAPLLLHERVSYIKTSIFPTEMLAWIAAGRALAYAGISSLVLLIFQVVLTGAIPPTVLLLPLIAVPLLLFLLGIVWSLAALGAFTRDIAYLMATIVPMLMIATPVFYRVSDLPAALQTVAYLNPLAVPIEMARCMVLGGAFPPLAICLLFLAVSFAVFRTGFAVFMRYKGILADVI